MFAWDVQKLASLLDESAGPGVRLVAADDISQCLSELTALADNGSSDIRLLIRVWDALPVNGDLRTDVLDSLARCASAIWPTWYGDTRRTIVDSPSLAAQQCTNSALACGVRRDIDDSWLRHAVADCLAGRLPRVRHLTPAEEAAQLTLAIGKDRFILTLAVIAPPKDAEKLFAFARLCEWLVAHANLRLIVVVAPSIARTSALDSISFAMVELGDEPTPCDEEPCREPDAVNAACETSHVREWLVGTLIGRPHPYSRGEQLLWAAICDDNELSGLFACNQPVVTNLSTEYLVDLLCKSLRVVIEVDGYYWHSGPAAFSRDRRRDYELALTDYLVLRLPHDEVVADPNGALTKVRALVRFRRDRNPSAANEIADQLGFDDSRATEIMHGNRA